MGDHESVAKGKFALPTNTYDVLKDIALLYLPALAVLYAALAAVWGWGYTVEVAGTILAIDTFLGVVLKISTVSYNNSAKSTDGVLVVDQSDPRADKYSLNITTPLEDVADANKIVLKIQNQTPIVKL